MGNTMLEREIEATVLRMVARRTEVVRAIASAMGLKDPTMGEGDRLATLKARAVAPETCGPDMPVAPARGRMVRVAPVAMQLTDEGWAPQHGGFRGRDAARAADVFDEMARQARRAGGDDPFTQRQKGAGRAYAALVERHSAVGLKGRSVETMLTGRSGRGGDGVMDIILDEGAEIAAMRSAVGDGWALVVVRQSKRKRTPLTVSELVDRVCLRGETVSAILDACGWSVYGESRDWARAALAEALDRMADTMPKVS